MFNKVFCIGFNKTGTSSLHKLFEDLGLKSWHGYYSHVPVSDPLYLQFQCFSDGDQHDFALLDRTFPGSRFILTTRRFEDWLVSRIRHIEHRRSINATGPMRQEYEAHPAAAVQGWIRRRLAYHRSVLDYFQRREADLLVIDLCGGQPAETLQAILRFLGIAGPPGLGLPHENVRAEAIGPASAVRPKADVREEVAAAFRALGLEPALRESVMP